MAWIYNQDFRRNLEKPEKIFFEIFKRKFFAFGNLSLAFFFKSWSEKSCWVKLVRFLGQGAIQQTNLSLVEPNLQAREVFSKNPFTFHLS